MCYRATPGHGRPSPVHMKPAGKRHGGTVTEDRLSAGQDTVASAGSGATGGGAGDGRAAIVVVDRDAGDRETLFRELTGVTGRTTGSSSAPSPQSLTGG